MTATLTFSVVTLGNNLHVAGHWSADPRFALGKLSATLTAPGIIIPTVDAQMAAEGGGFTIDQPTKGIAEGVYDLVVSVEVNGQTTQSDPVRVALSDHRVATGEGHGDAVLSDGSVMPWGKLDTGTERASLGAQQLPANMHPVWQVAAAGAHSLALTFDGQVIAWGDNLFGQRDVPAGLVDVVQIAAGPTHSLALKRDGTLVAWGETAQQGSFVDGVSPGKIPKDIAAQIASLGHHVVKIAAGAGHNLLILDTGKVLPLGYLHYDNEVRALENVVSMVTNSFGGVAITAAGALVGVGYGDLSSVKTAAKIAGDRTGANLIITNTGALFSWFASGSFAPSRPTVADAMQIAMGYSTAAVLEANGTLSQWDPTGNGLVRSVNIDQPGTGDFLPVPPSITFASPNLLPANQSVMGSITFDPSAQFGQVEVTLNGTFIATPHDYKVVETPGATWEGALIQAQAWLAQGWYLATVTSQVEQDTIGALLDNVDTGYDHFIMGAWLAPATQGGFRWLNGEPWLFTKWGGLGNEPNGNGNSHYLGMRRGEGWAWNDFDLPFNADRVAGIVLEKGQPGPALSHAANVTQFGIPLPALMPGVNTLVVKATDSDGRISSAQFQFQQTGPESGIILDGPPVRLSNSSFEVSGRVVGAGINNLQVMVDGSPLKISEYQIVSAPVASLSGISPPEGWSFVAINSQQEQDYLAGRLSPLADPVTPKQFLIGAEKPYGAWLNGDPWQFQSWIAQESFGNTLAMTQNSGWRWAWFLNLGNASASGYILEKHTATPAVGEDGRFKFVVYGDSLQAGVTDLSLTARTATGAPLPSQHLLLAYVPDSSPRIDLLAPSVTANSTIEGELVLEGYVVGGPLKSANFRTDASEGVYPLNIKYGYFSQKVPVSALRQGLNTITLNALDTNDHAAKPVSVTVNVTFIQPQFFL